MVVYIEALKESFPIAVGKALNDGTFQQDLPLYEMFQTKETWQDRILMLHGEGVVFEEKSSLDYTVDGKKPSWTCKYCERGHGHNHAPCVKEAGSYQTFLVQRIWSDSRIQKLFKYQS